MPQAAPDEVFRQHSRFPSDNSSYSQDIFRVAWDQESARKSNKKGKNGSKGKTKEVKSVVEAAEEFL
jgi:hypothetical protein